LTIAEFKSVLRAVGTSIIGQTATLAPADKKIYALRDVTSTVESIPLIASSVMSKKLAEGSNAVLLDVKCGDGAFMKTVGDARALAEAMVTIGRLGGIPTEAFVTDMDAPLGSAIGNSLEMVECFDTLKGAGPTELNAVATRLASRMVVLAGLEHDAPAAAARVESALTSGRALQTLSRMIELQGGNPRVVTDYRLMPSAPDRAVVSASRSGFVTRMAALAIGRAAHVLGAGRSKVGEPVDHGVGAVTLAHVGDQVREGQPLIELHHRGGRGLDDALALSREAIVIDDQPPATRAKILDEVR
jgi:pyrimidine-nucleoside phosphorylase